VSIATRDSVRSCHFATWDEILLEPSTDFEDIDVLSARTGPSMNRLAALYDIHGNLPALEAVLAEVHGAGVHQILIGGDVFPGPMAREVLHRLRELDIPVLYIRGNGERAVADVAAGRQSAGLPPALVPLMEWHVAQLDPTDVQSMEAWPPTMTLSIASHGDVLFCHATPRDDNEMFNASTPGERIAPAFAGIAQRLVVCGHTHRPFERMVGDVRVVNAGSVGMPFSGTEAEWLLIGDDLEPRRTAYDLADAERRIRATDYPRADEFIQVALR